MPNPIAYISLFSILLTFNVGADSWVEPPPVAPTQESLDDWMTAYGFEVDEFEEKARAYIQADQLIECRAPSRRVTLNGMELWLHDGILVDSNGQWTAASEDLEQILAPLIRPLENLPNSSQKLIVLDAGHGGKDEGAKGHAGGTEKEYALDITHRVETMLKTLGYEVLLTRDHDTYLELADRPRIAHEAGAAIFVSIHLNKSSNRAARGIETYMLTAPGFRSSNDPGGEREYQIYKGHEHLKSSMVLAGSVHRHLVQNSSMRDRGIKRARFVVLREAQCPAILLECGFLSNPTEEKLFSKSTFRDYIARRVSNGIHHYMGKLNKAQIKHNLLNDEG